MKKISKTLLLIAWLCLIFYLSNQNASISGSLSSGLLRIIGTIINKFITIDIDTFIKIFGTFIRKLAHFSEYFILFILSYQCFKEYGINKLLFTFVFCLLCASLDEIHQLFIDGRCGSVIDVGIDSLGILFSLFICHLKNK